MARVTNCDLSVTDVVWTERSCSEEVKRQSLCLNTQVGRKLCLNEGKLLQSSLMECRVHRRKLGIILPSSQ